MIPGSVGCILMISWSLWLSQSPPHPLQQNSLISIKYSAVGFCICSHQLPDEASMMTITLNSGLRVQQNIIRNHFTDFFSFANLIWFHPWSGLPGSVRRGIPLCGIGLNLNQPLIRHSHKLCATFTPAQLQSGFMAVFVSQSPSAGNFACLKKMVSSGSYSPLLGVFIMITLEDSWEFPLH